jgi:predicted MFS family arabinose efflux permease
MGTGIFGFFSKGLTAALIDLVGWRGAYAGLGLLPLLIAVPASLLLLRESPVSTSAGTSAIARPGGMTVRQTLSDWRFWLMAIGFFAVSLVLGGIPPNLEKILSDTGLPLSTVLWLTSLIGLSAVVGRVIGGWLVDIIWAPAIAFLILGMPAISCWLLASGDLDLMTSGIAIVLVGFALGVEYDLMAFLLGRYFGLKSYTITYSILYVFFSLGAGFGPWAFAYRYRVDQSYGPALVVAAAALVAVAASFLFLGKYRNFQEDSANA